MQWPRNGRIERWLWALYGPYHMLLDAKGQWSEVKTEGGFTMDKDLISRYERRLDVQMKGI